MLRWNLADRAPTLPLAVALVGVLAALAIDSGGSAKLSQQSLGPAAAYTPTVAAAPRGPSTPDLLPPLASPSVTELERLHQPVTTAPATTVATTAPPTTVAVAPVQVPALRGALPIGKGMWIWQPEASSNGHVGHIVNRAMQTGLSHIYVRTGSSWKGNVNKQFLDDLLPRAHGAGIRVYGWDFPKLLDWGGDVERALTAIKRTTPSGDRLDGFAADIETANEGTRITPGRALAYSTALRNAVGPDYPLIGCVPRPSAVRLRDFPYKEVLSGMSAAAPMVYWLNRQPDSDVRETMEALQRFGKPILPVGQAYNGGPEGGRHGVPPPEEINRFMAAAEDLGASGVSFWSWQAADDRAWETIRTSPHFVVPAGPPAAWRPGQVRALQDLLTHLGFPVPADGVYGAATMAAVAAYQQAANLPANGVVDDATRRVLLTPFPPRLQ